MRLARALIGVSLALATAGSTAVKTAAALWLTVGSDHAHTASLAIDRVELNVRLHHGQGTAVRAGAAPLSVGEADHEVRLSDAESGVVTERRVADPVFAAPPSPTPGTALSSHPNVPSHAFGLDPDPPPAGAPPVLRV